MPHTGGTGRRLPGAERLCQPSDNATTADAPDTSQFGPFNPVVPEFASLVPEFSPFVLEFTSPVFEFTSLIVRSFRS